MGFSGQTPNEGTILITIFSCTVPRRTHNVCDKESKLYVTDELKEKEIEGKGVGRNYENVGVEKIRRKGNKNISKKNYKKNARRKGGD